MITDVAVVVPAHDEAADIADCLAAVAGSADHAERSLHTRVRVRVCVVLDACTDSTSEIVRGFGGCEVIAVGGRNVGAARAAGVEGLLDAAVPSERVWIASTDADSMVPVDWISRMVRLADHGADVVLGTVVPAAGLSHDVQAKWRGRHSLRDGHGHVHGANLGIRASAYVSLGGWPPLTIGEDVALAARAQMAGHLRVVRTAGIPVLTKPRLNGRAVGGFADFLRDLHPMPITG